MIELTNGVQISEDRLIQKATASVDSLSSTGKLEVMQYDDKMPVAAVTLTSKAVTWTPPEGAALRVRMGKPDGHGVLNDALGMDADGTVYFAFTRQMTAANGAGEISIEIGADDGVKSSAPLPVTIKKNPVQDDKIQSTDEYLTLDAILTQASTAATQAGQAAAQAAQTLASIPDDYTALCRATRALCFALDIGQPLQVSLADKTVTLAKNNTLLTNTHAFSVTQELRLDLSDLQPKAATYVLVYNETDKQLHLRPFSMANTAFAAQAGDVALVILYLGYSGGAFIYNRVYAFLERNLFLDGEAYTKNADFVTETVAAQLAAAIPYRVLKTTNVRISIDTAARTLSIQKTGSPAYLWYDAKRPVVSLAAEEATVSYEDFLNNTAFVQYSEDKVLTLSKASDTKAQGMLGSIWFRSSGEVHRINCTDELKPIFYVDGAPYFGTEDSTDALPDYHPHGVCDVGCLNYQNIGETDYSHIILYGQSLSMGWQAPEVITTDPVKNTFMVGSSPMINHGNDGSLTINPLKAVKWTSGGEQPIVAMTNAFAKIYHRFVNANQKFIGTNCGEGGRSIEQLMKQCTNGTNYYTTEFLDCINSAKAACDAEGASISCTAIVYMQGEYNYISRTGTGLTPGTDATNDKDQYKAYLAQLKQDMQADIMAAYGQTEPPLFFLYQVAGSYINNKEMTINMAQLEFARENEDVILLNSTYGMPDYNGGHLSTNGYRWYGELVAKQLAQMLVKGVAARSVELEELQVTGNQITLCFYVPVSPLVFDTHTKEAVADNGFRLYCDGAEVSITGMEIQGNRVLLTAERSLTGTVELTYGGQGRNGSGNLRDSDGYLSLYRYYDDRQTAPDQQENFTPTDAQGAPLYGRHYPLYNWCNQFYEKLEV